MGRSAPNHRRFCRESTAYGNFVRLVRNLLVRTVGCRGRQAMARLAVPTLERPWSSRDAFFVRRGDTRTGCPLLRIQSTFLASRDCRPREYFCRPRAPIPACVGLQLPTDSRVKPCLCLQSNKHLSLPQASQLRESCSFFRANTITQP